MTKIYSEQKTNFYFDEKDKTENELNENQIDFNKPPNEDILASRTLWPERNKLYGHHFEISLVRYNKDRKILVSACKSLE